jgi:cytochrome P450
MATATMTDELVFDPNDHATIFDPHALFKRLRDEAPLYHNPHLNFYAVSRFDDVEKVLLTRDVFISRRGCTLDMLRMNREVPPGTLIFEDEPHHGIHRALLSRMFTPRRVASLEPDIRQLCADLLDPFVGSDGFDFVQDLAAMVPMQVIGMLLGIPAEDQVKVRDHFAERREMRIKDKENAGNHYSHNGEIFSDYIDYRMANPSDDIMTHLLTTEFVDADGVTKRLSKEELLRYVSIIASAGNDTTKVLIGFAGKLLAEFPDQRRRLVEDPTLVPNAVEEVLRYEPNTLANCRWADSDFEMHGQVVPAGSIMVTLTPAAGRDERRFDDPDRFDVAREAGKHMYFGFGSHYCLGQALARLEGRVVLEEVLRRFPEWDTDLAHAEFTHLTDARGYSKLPIVLP